MEQRLRLMCSHGGIIVASPHDNMLRYVGGDTRLVDINRHASLSDLSLHLSKTLLLLYSSFVLKYQLPGEDLDTLISVTSDEDLQYMIDEYDRINSIPNTERSFRLRVFLIPLKHNRISLTGLNWFLDSFKGFTSISGNVCSELPSVNSLLGLDDGIRNGNNFDAIRNCNSSEDGINNEQSQVVQYQIPNEEDAENAIYEYDSMSTISRNTASTRVQMFRSHTKSSAVGSIGSGATKSDDCYFKRFSTVSSTISRNTASTRARMLGVLTKSDGYSVASIGSGATNSDDWYFNRFSTVTTVPTSTPTEVFSDTSSVKSCLSIDDDFIVNQGAVIADDNWVWQLWPWIFGGRAQS